jgi:hypothetical protein
LESSDLSHNATGSPAAESRFRAAIIELGVLGMLILVMVTSIYVLHQTRKPSSVAGAATVSR